MEKLDLTFIVDLKVFMIELAKIWKELVLELQQVLHPLSSF